MNFRKSEIILIVLATIFGILALAFIIAFATKETPCPTFDPTKATLFNDITAQTDIQRRLRDAFFPEKPTGKRSQDFMVDHWKYMTQQVHVAGTAESLRVSQYIHDKFVEYGLDRVEMPVYDKVLLSYPDYDQPNTISIILSNGTSKLVSKGQGVLSGDQRSVWADQVYSDRKHADVWFNAYSTSGSATGPLVYANYGEEADFVKLEKEGVKVNGSIVLVRYGKLWRGGKVYSAKLKGAVGVIIYSDPEDCMPHHLAFPDGVDMPSGGAQRGSCLMGDGDPLTPLYPSKPYTYRWFDNQTLRTDKNDYRLPAIPVTPISYGDVRELFASMDGVLAPEDFQGNLTDVVYRLNSSVNVRMNVQTHDEQQNIRNVIGYIRGGVEPDRYVILCNHHDAWTYGAIDPQSGTVVMLEVARVLRAIMNETGWRPRRTIVFAAWDAEEYGLIGSTEWLQDYLKELEMKAVTLLNVDIAVMGNDTFLASTVPLLYDVMANATKTVQNPRKELQAKLPTVFDTWIYVVKPDPVNPDVPFMPPPGSGSDHIGFLSYVGIPVAYFGYVATTGEYPLYHTMFDVQWLIENMTDTDDLACHRAVAQFWAECARSVADSLVIPFSVDDYGRSLEAWIENGLLKVMKKLGIDRIVDNFEVIANGLRGAAAEFKNASLNFQLLVDRANAGSSIKLMEVEALNLRLQHLERSFVLAQGLPNRPAYRHLLFAPGAVNSYASSLFSGVFDSFSYYEKAEKGSEEAELQRKNVNMQLTAIRNAIDSAMRLLEMK